MTEYEIHAAASPAVQAWMQYNELPVAPKGTALMRRDRNGRLQVWSWHTTEAGAKRAIQNTASNRVVR